MFGKAGPRKRQHPVCPLSQLTGSLSYEIPLTSIYERPGEMAQKMALSRESRKAGQLRLSTHTLLTTRSLGKMFTNAPGGVPVIPRDRP